MFNRTPEQTPLEAARAEVRRLAELELKLFTDLAPKRETVASIEQNAGEQLLDGADVAETAATLTRAQAELALMNRAIEAAHHRRIEAIRACYRAEAAGLRQQAADKRAELAAIEKRTGPLLAKLSEVEGVTFTPAILDAQLSPQSDAVAVTYLRPKSTILREEITATEDRAAELDKRDPLQFEHGGHAVAATLAELVSKSLEDPFRATPALPEIAEWVADIERKIEKNYSVSPRKYSLQWSGGKVDRNSSTVTVGHRNDMHTAA
jgi:hypothetical protein